MKRIDVDKTPTSVSDQPPVAVTGDWTGTGPLALTESALTGARGQVAI